MNTVGQISVHFNIWWFENADTAALMVVSHFFWSVHRQELSEEQRLRILNFWRHCVDYAQRDLASNTQLLSSLGRLISYLESITEEDEARLLLIAPYSHVNHNEDWFLRDLEPLSLVSAEAVCRILNRALDAHIPNWDFEDHLKSIIRNIAAQSSKADALRLIDRLRHIRGMGEFFDEVSKGKVA